jgi:argininosuccinate lyase
MEVGRLKSQLGHAEQQAEEANATIKAMEATIRIWAHDAAGDPIKQAAYDKLCQVLATTEAAYKRALKVLAQLERELSQERANVERTREDLHLAQLRIGELTWVDTAASAAQKGQEG